MSKWKKGAKGSVPKELQKTWATSRLETEVKSAVQCARMAGMEKADFMVMMSDAWEAEVERKALRATMGAGSPAMKP